MKGSWRGGVHDGMAAAEARMLPNAYPGALHLMIDDVSSRGHESRLLLHGHHARGGDVMVPLARLSETAEAGMLKGGRRVRGDAESGGPGDADSLAAKGKSRPDSQSCRISWAPRERFVSAVATSTRSRLAVRVAVGGRWNGGMVGGSLTRRGGSFAGFRSI